MVFEKTLHFSLKLGFRAFFFSVFRRTPRTSSVFRLSLLSLNFWLRKKISPSEGHMLKWTKEMALQDWFLWRQWIIENIIVEQITLHYPLLTPQKYCFKQDICLKRYILWDKEPISALQPSISSFSQGKYSFCLISFTYKTLPLPLYTIYKQKWFVENIPLFLSE